MDNGGLMGINEWGFMGIYNIPGLSINPEGDLWIKINSHKSPYVFIGINQNLWMARMIIISLAITLLQNHG